MRQAVQDEKETETNYSKIITGIPEKTSAARVYEDGRMEVLKIKGEFERFNDKNTLVSPDGRFLVLAKKRTLELLNIESGEKLLIHTGASEKEIIVPLEWSVNNDKLIFRIENNDKIDYFLYNTVAKTKDSINLPGTFICFAANDEILLLSENKIILQGKKTREIPIRASDFYYIQRSPDGKSIVALYEKVKQIERLDADRATLKVVQIVSIDLDSGKLTFLTPEGSYAEYHNPLPSPSGKKIAYIRHPARDEFFLEVNQKRIIQFRGGPKNFDWIGNRNLILTDECGLRTVNISTGVVKNLQNYPESKYNFLCYPDSQLPTDEEFIDRKLFRVISESGLFLREEASPDSKQILLIPFAHTVLTSRRKTKEVKIQGKTGYWTLVSYSLNGRDIEGWVFDGFLGSIQKKVTISNIADFKSGCLGSACKGYGAHRLAPDGTYMFGPRCEGDKIITGRWALVGNEIYVCSKPDCNPVTDEKYIVFRPTKEGKMVYEQKGLGQIILSEDQITHWEPIQ